MRKFARATFEVGSGSGGFSLAELFNELEVWGCAGEGVVASAPGTQLAAYIGSQLPRGGCHKSAKHTPST